MSVYCCMWRISCSVRGWCVLHCEVLQLPCTFYWLWIWLVWHGRNWSVCVCVCVEVGKMAKDIGMTIRKGIVVPFLPCLVAFWGFH